jgi:hypothetical protein
MVHGNVTSANTAKVYESSSRQINGNDMKTMQNLNSPCVIKQCRRLGGATVCDAVD